MDRSAKITFLFHSRILFISGLGTVIYKIEKFFYKNRVIKTLIISRKDNNERDILLRLVSNRADYIIVKSYKFGRILKNLKPEIIADFLAPANLSKLLVEKLHEISWTLILAKRATSRTKKSLGSFLPKTFPITEVRDLTKRA